jgi:GH24 family phage-related lysozyme (muramidase)
MIPVSVNFTTDGISGLSMGQAFTVPDILLPYTYTTRKIPGAPQDHLKNVGFAVIGLTHTIENNQWNTAVRANMIYLKDKTEFTGSVVKVDTRTGTFGINEFNDVSLSIGSASLSDLNINQPWQDIAVEFIAKKEGFLTKPKPDEGTLRAGYGTDKIVTIDGIVKSVGIDTVFTKEDAKRTLVYQIKNTFSTKIISQIGKQNWERLNDKQKAALVSYAYNAGSLRSNLVAAIKNNAPNQIVANAIIAGPTTGKQSGRVYPVLIQRRKEEAALYLS